MHIEAGVVNDAKIVLSYATAAAAGGFVIKEAAKSLFTGQIIPLALRSLIATVLVFIFFEIFPHFAVGVSEVHFILGSTLFLLFGMVPAAIGLASGLLIQGLFLAPFDLPQYGMNMTTLLVPMIGIYYLAQKIIPNGTRYVDLSYGQALKLSTAYQGGIVTWVAFWAFYGQGFGIETVQNVSIFMGAYAVVLLVEPIADLGALALAKKLIKGTSDIPVVFDPHLTAQK